MKKVDNTNTVPMSEIQCFFKDSSVFVTGATGFLGHVLLAKLLKSCPDLKKIYVLLRPKKGKNVCERFQVMLEEEVFESLKSECPSSLLKIHPIAGDCQIPKLGIADSDAQLLKEEVNIVFHVAATVRFDAPLKQAVHMNVRSTSDLLDMAREMKKLKSFVHVSTAFSHCVDREVIEEKLYEPPISGEQLIQLVDNLNEDVINKITPSLLGNYPNTYIFTKAAAEDICRIKGVGLPLAIFRPAIVISTVNEPLAGWINNVYGPTGVAAAAGVGLLHVLLVEKNSRANIVPCDYVVNAIIASAWNVGLKTRILETELVKGIDDLHTVKKKETNETIITNISNNELIPNEKTHECVNNEELTSEDTLLEKLNISQTLPVFNYTCDLLEKPFTWQEFSEINGAFEKEFPSCVSVWSYSLILIRNKYIYNLLCMLLHLFPAFLADTCAKLLGRKPKLMDAYRKLHKLSDVLAFFSTQEWKISNENVIGLWKKLSDKDKEIFDFDMSNIDWNDFYHQHVSGIRKYILKETPETIPSARKRRLVFLALHYLLISTLSFASFYIIFKLTKLLLR